MNLTAHVWAWMKRWIQNHYFQGIYNAQSIYPEQLLTIVTEEWNACPDDFILSLYKPWRDRCNALTEARGEPNSQQRMKFLSSCHAYLLIKRER